MKKFLTIISCCLIVAFCFAGCSASKKQVETILNNQITFATTQEQNLTSSNDLFSNDLKTEYSTFYNETQISSIETIIESTNLSLSRLKSYLQIETFTKNLDKNDAKEITKLTNNYYKNFEQFITSKNTLEEIIIKGGQNTKKDYELLNKKIFETIKASNLASSKLIDFVKENLSADITSEQIEIGSGVLELMLLDSLNNCLTFYTEIYFNEAQFKNFITYQNQVSNPLNTFNEILNTFNSCTSSKFDLNSTNFVNVKNSILILQTYNNELKNEKEIFNKTIKKFDYQSFKSSFEKFLPNAPFDSLNVKTFIDNDNIEIETKTNYKYLSTTIYGKLNPTISTLNSIIATINSL